MTHPTRIALVTGGNKGIGLEICRQLAQQHGCTVLLGARDKARGEQAAKQLQSQGLSVRAVQLDTTDTTSFSKLYDLIASDYGHLDILVNNAGIGLDWEVTADDVPIALVRDTFETNFFSVITLTQTLLPLLRKSPAGRIVNQSSILGSLTLHATPGSKLENIKPLAYNASKAALNAFTIHLAAALKGTPIKVNSAHPGSVLTDMNPEGHLSVEEGAKTAVQLATLPPEGPTGGFFHLDKNLPW